MLQTLKKRSYILLVVVIVLAIQLYKHYELGATDSILNRIVWVVVALVAFEIVVFAVEKRKTKH